MFKKSIDLRPGDAFLFRYHSHWWQYLRRGYGGAKVIALEPHHDVVHLSILGQEEADDKSTINHVPILTSHVVAAYVQDIPAKKPEWRDTTHAWEDLSNWRSAVAAGEASAFDLPLGTALTLICQTWEDHHPTSTGPMSIASAVPVRGSGGSFNVIRIIAFEEQQLEPGCA